MDEMDDDLEELREYLEIPPGFLEELESAPIGVPMKTWKSVKVYTTRDVTQEECRWLRHDIPAGTTFWTYPDFFGCCGPDGVAVSRVKLERPYFEVPRSAVCESAQVVEFSVN